MNYIDIDNILKRCIKAKAITDEQYKTILTVAREYVREMSDETYEDDLYNLALSINDEIN